MIPRSVTSQPVARNPRVKASAKAGELSRQSRPRATSFLPRPRKYVPMARPSVSTTLSSRSWPTMPRISYSLKILGLMFTIPPLVKFRYITGLLISAALAETPSHLP